MIRVTRRYTFSASHRLDIPSMTEEANRELFGKCNNPFGHGHNYVLDVSVRGPVDERTGRAVDPVGLDRLVRERVLSKLHLKNLNEEIETFRDVVPTTENIGLLIHQDLKQNWRSAFPGDWPQLEKVRIEETERNIFEISESR